MDSPVIHWIAVGMMSATFILVLKYIFTGLIKVPGITPLVGSI